MIFFRNLLALVIGLAVGGGINMGLIMVGSLVIPPPAGVDMTNAESVAASAHLLEARHYAVSFLAHALGTLVGAMLGFLIAGSHRTLITYAIGGAFLAGGIMAASMIPAPTSFITFDLVAAYIPMAYFGGLWGEHLAGGRKVGRRGRR